jgi:hypothetical protein
MVESRVLTIQAGCLIVYRLGTPFRRTHAALDFLKRDFAIESLDRVVPGSLSIALVLPRSALRDETWHCARLAAVFVAIVVFACRFDLYLPSFRGGMCASEPVRT